MNMTFCEECRKDVPYSVESSSMIGTLKGEEYGFTGKKAICAECGAEVYVGEIEDENLKILYDAYRQKKGIISLEKILEPIADSLFLRGGLLWAACA